MRIAVGTVLKGFCNGFFGRDSYHDKRIEAIGADWVVVREEDGLPNFANFSDADEMDKWLQEWTNAESTPE